MDDEITVAALHPVVATDEAKAELRIQRKATKRSNRLTG